MSPARLARISYRDLEGGFLHPVNGIGETGKRVWLEPVRPGARKANLWKADRKVRLAESESAWKIEQVTTE